MCNRPANHPTAQMHVHDPERPGNQPKPTARAAPSTHRPACSTARPSRHRCLSQNAGVQVILECFPRRPKSEWLRRCCQCVDEEEPKRPSPTSTPRTPTTYTTTNSATTDNTTPCRRPSSPPCRWLGGPATCHSNEAFAAARNRVASMGFCICT